MACFYPRSAYYSAKMNISTGKRSITFRRSEGMPDLGTLSMPCGQCIGCRLERSRQWAMRCLHESSLYADNSFVTLTYAPAFLPPHGSLVVSHIQLFMKRLRKRFSPDKIRFFLCGEYGDSTKRPHYHVLLFNLWFPDAVASGISETGFKCFRSDILDSLWGKGRCEFGSVTFESAAYVARYVCKKVLGSSDVSERLRDSTYGVSVNPNTGEVTRPLLSEFVVMSRRPGIGRPWLNKFHEDVFPRDYYLLRGKKVRLPKYYTSILSESNPEVMGFLKAKRSAHFDEFDNTSHRLAVKEAVALSKFSLFSRSFEHG